MWRERYYFFGPKVSVLESLGDKITAKKVAVTNQIPIIQSNENPLTNIEVAIEKAKKYKNPARR